MDLGLKDKVVAITGGTSGIGEGTALEFAAQGCKVAVCGRNVGKIEAFAQRAKAAGHDVLALRAEIGDPKEERAFLDAVIDAYGAVDIWFNNAGVGTPGELSEVSDAEWDRVMNIDLKALWRCTNMVVPHMKERGGGVILNTSSWAAIMPTAGSGVYAIAKTGVLAMTKVAAAELAPFNIRVNAIIPGVIWSDMVRASHTDPEYVKVRREALSANRFGDPEDIAPMIVCLAGNPGRYMTGAAVEVSGGKLLVQNPMAPWMKHGAY